jgi:hypothetical protein
VAWVTHAVTDSVEPENICLYDPGVGVMILTTNGQYDTLDIGTPHIDDAGVAWIQVDPYNPRLRTTYFYDFSTWSASQIPGYAWGDPQSDGSLAVVSRHDGLDREIFLINRSLGSEEKLTNNHFEDRYPRVSGNNIAWVGGEGNGSEIYLAVAATPADIHMEPNPFDLSSAGKRMTGYIELPEGFDVNQIDVSTVTLSVAGATFGADVSRTSVGDYDKDGIPDRTVKFDRQAVRAEGLTDMVVGGSIVGGGMFSGTDTVLVVP